MITTFSEFIKENFDTNTYDFHQDDIFKDWIAAGYSSNPKAVKEFNKWLKQHYMSYCHMYHGTDAAIPILEQGLKRTTAKTKKSYQSQTGFVYLSIYPTMAKTFGEMANPYAKEIAVYRVMVRIGELVADKDQLFNKRMYSSMDVKDTLAESIIYGHGARIKRDIYVNELSLFSKAKK